MIQVRRSAERGHANHGWLDSHHTFSFADYHDPRFMGFRNLRVINEDRVQAGRGFGAHPHRDMEILSYVLSGGLQHRDSLGTGSVIRPGDVQLMSAGTGVTHSEFNASKEEIVHFLQIWLLPRARGVAPAYRQKTFEREEKDGRLRLVASPDAADGSLPWNADARLYAGLFDGAQAGEIPLSPGRSAWIQVVRGQIRANGHPLAAGDGMALGAEPAVQLEGGAGAEVLVFDLA